MTYFTEQDPPSLTEAQAAKILALVQNGAKIQSITLHPYSGAASVSDSWKASGDVIAIINQGGALSYHGKGISLPDWIYNPDAA